MRPAPTLALALAVAMAGCRDAPPRDLAGFRLDMSQEEVMAEARSRGDFNCSLRGARPPLMTCEGPAIEGQPRVVVRDNSTIYISVRMEGVGSRPERTTQRFVRKFGDPVWRERRHPVRFNDTEGYHTLWLDPDSTRALAMICAGPTLTPPCVAELARTSPRAVEAKLDSLLRIRR